MFPGTRFFKHLTRVSSLNPRSLREETVTPPTKVWVRERLRDDSFYPLPKEAPEKRQGKRKEGGKRQDFRRDFTSQPLPLLRERRGKEQKRERRRGQKMAETDPF